MSYFTKFPKVLYQSANTTDAAIKVVPNITAKVGFIKDVLDNMSMYQEYTIRDFEKPEDIAYKFYNDVTKHWIVLLANNVKDPQYDWVMDSDSFDRYIDKKYSDINLQLDTTEPYPSNYTVGELVYQGNRIEDAIVTANVIAYNVSSKILTVSFASESFANSANVIGVNSSQTHKITTIQYANNGYEWASNTTIHYQVTETKVNSYDNIPVVDKYIISAKDYLHSSDTVIDINTNTTTQSSYNLVDGTTLTITKTISPVTYYDYEVSLNEARRNIKIPKLSYVPLIVNQFAALMRNN
jgi:hypothetical protein